MPESKVMVYRRFEETDFEWYSDWYKHAAISKWLGPVLDPNWLTCVLSDDSPAYVLHSEGTPLCVIGIQLDDGIHGFNVITDIAVNPHHQKRGHGRRVIFDVVSGKFPIKRAKWASFVDNENHMAKALFSKYATSISSNSDNMTEYHIDPII